MPADYSTTPRGGRKNASAPKRRSAPKPAPKPKGNPQIFGPIGRADKPITTARKNAHRNTRRAERKMPSPVAPAIPKLKNPTPKQRQAAVDLTRRSLKNQGINGSNYSAAKRAADPVTRKRLSRYEGAVKTQIRHAQVARTLQLLRNDPQGKQIAKLLGVKPSKLGSSTDVARLARMSRAGQIPKGAFSQLADAGEAYGREVMARNIVRPGRDHRTKIAGLATVDFGRLQRGIATQLASGHGYGLVRNVPHIAANAVSDAVNLPRGAVLGLYETGAAINEATQKAIPATEFLPGKGSYSRGTKLIKGLDDGFVGQLVQGNFDEAVKQFGEHPLNSLLEVTGAGQVVGRVAGAGARAGLAGSRAKAFSNQARPAKHFAAGSKVSTGDRRYSPNLIVQAVQRRSDSKRTVNGQVVARTNGERSRVLNAAVDEFAGQQEGMRRRAREEVNRAVVDAMPRRGRLKAGPERDVVFMAVERRLRSPKTFEQDLRREYARLTAIYERKGDKMSAAAKHGNKQQRKAIKRVLDDPKALARADEVFAAATKVRKITDANEQELIRLGGLDPDQSTAAKVRAYAVSVMGAKPTKKGLKLDGEKLTTEQVVQHMRDNDVDAPGFLSQRRDTQGARAYFVNWFGTGRSKPDSKGKRTGKATQQGSYAANWQAVQNSVVHQRGVVDAIKGFDDFAGRYGVKHPEGRPLKWKEAEELADKLEQETGVEWTPIRAVPAKYDKGRMDAILNGQDSLPAHFAADLIDERMRMLEAAPGTDNVVLVPAAAVKRFRSHQIRTESKAARLGQAYTGLFRGTVLPFSTKWLTGNVAEAVFRMAVNGVTPADIGRGFRVMKALKAVDDEAYKQLDTRARGGLLYGSADRLSVHRTADDFKNSILEGPAKALGLLNRTVLKPIIAPLEAAQRGIFAANRSFEKLAQTGVIGKAARQEARDFTGSWAKAAAMSKDVATEVAKGLTGTDKQVRFARQVDEVLGKYSRFGPEMRRFTQSVAPFFPWFVNAAKFSFYVLPAKHPVLASLLASVEQTMKEEWAEQHKDAPPGDLRYAIPTGNGGFLPLARYTPTGLVTDLSPTTVLEPILPQLQSVWHNLYGRNWAGEKLQLANGEKATEEQRAVMALYTILEGTVPLVSIGRRLQERGETPYDDSRVWDPKSKPGTVGTKPGIGPAARRVFDPFRSTKVRPGASKSAPDAPAEPRSELDELYDALEQDAASTRDAELDELYDALQASP